MATALSTQARPLQLPYDDVWPSFTSDIEFCGQNVSIIGRLTIGARPSFGAGAVIRADGHYVKIGGQFYLGELSTVHIAHDLYPTIIGDRVAVGRNSVVHACTVGDDCVIEDGVVILDGSVVENGVLIEGGSTVFPRSRLDQGYIYAGSPAEAVRKLESDERRAHADRVRDAVVSASFSAGNERSQKGTTRNDLKVFIASTAQISGFIRAMEGSSIFFGCHLSATRFEIHIGRNTNIQDNTFVETNVGPVTIGDNTTLGHNVYLNSCSIGENSLIGIGCRVEPGAQVGDDVMLAAGSVATRDQRLEGGWLWGGRPARKLSALNHDRRAMMQSIVKQYRIYGEAFRNAQDTAGSMK